MTHYKAIKNKETGEWINILNGKLMIMNVPILLPTAVDLTTLEAMLDEDEIKYFREECRIVNVKVVDLADIN